MNGVATQIVLYETQLQGAAEELAGIPRGLERALMRAADKTGLWCRQRIIEVLAEQLTIRAAEMKRRNTAFRKALPVAGASVIISGRRIPLRRFQARQDARGIAYEIHPGQPKELPGSFFAEMKTGHRGVFARAARGQTRRVYTVGPDGRRHSSELPIRERFGPSVPVEMSYAPPLASENFDMDLTNRFALEIDRQVQLIVQERRDYGGDGTEGGES